VSGPPEAPVQWTPRITIVCAWSACGKTVTREWSPHQPPPKFCGPKCKAAYGRKRNKLSRRAREASGEGLGEIVTVTVLNCARPGCYHTGQRKWHTAADKYPQYCSERCRRAHQAQIRRDRHQADRVARCEHPDKLAYRPTPDGVRFAARDAVKFEKYVYSCNCFHLHLTSTPRRVPAECTDPRLSFNDRWAAWHDYLNPIAARLRERWARWERETE
jgi:hypothetical protein